MSPSKKPTKMDMTTTIMVSLVACSRVGHTTLLNSAMVSRKNCRPWKPRTLSGLTCRDRRLTGALDTALPYLSVDSVLATPRAVLGELQALWVTALILHGGVITLPAITASHSYYGPDLPLLPCHCLYSSTLVITPAPTVRPPSLIAKRSPGSIATGLMSFIPIFTLSPGMIISTPAGRAISPVTSVVRM